MRRMDEDHTQDGSKGVIGMTDFLREEGFKVGERKVRRLMRLMGIQALYPKKHLSTLGEVFYIKKYLLRGLAITHRNQVWSIDITYIPMKKGFMYLTAIIDVYSRFIVGWGLHNTLDTSNCDEVFESAAAKYGAPETISSDQGCQFTSREWADMCAKHPKMQVSMDGRGRAKDNIWIERFWRTIKYQYIYIRPEENGTDLYKGIQRFIERYNFHRRHQGINRKVPGKLYLRLAA